MPKECTPSGTAVVNPGRDINAGYVWCNHTVTQGSVYSFCMSVLNFSHPPPFRMLGECVVLTWFECLDPKSGSGLANALVYANADQPQLSKDSCSYLCEGVPVCTAVG